MREYVSDILIVGASFGGISAAIAACKAGSRVILTEETSWLGGQATSQGVPLDEHPWIEQYGSNESYRDFRRRIRDFYRRNYSLSFEANKDERFNPGACWVSALGFEPRVGQLVIEELLSQYKTAGLLTVWKNTKPAKVFEENDQIQAISFSSETGEKIVYAKYFLEATELGDLLDLGSVEHVIGAESQSDTGEPLALDKADPQKQQPFTYIIAVEMGEEDSDTIEKPSEYEFFKSNFDHISAFCDSVQSGKIIGNGLPNGLFSKVCNDGKYHPDLWNFRRYFYKGNFDNRFFLSDVTALMVGNEYKDGVLCGVSESERNYHISQSRELSKSLVYYLQKEVPFNEKYGIPGLRVSKNAFETEDGLARYPYIREARRIKACFTIKEQDFLISEHPDGPANYYDTVGVAGYRIDIHEKSRNMDTSITSAAHGHHWTQQIPLGALIPVRVKNLIASCKNIGTTHVTNGAYRLHPVEWSIGEAAGALAAFCIRNSKIPIEVRNNEDILHEFQRELSHRGVEMYWPTMHFGMSYFSCFREIDDWYFGEADKIGNSSFITGRY